MSYSVYNSTTRPVSTGSEYLGSGEPCNPYEGVHVSFITDLTSSLYLEWSKDNSNFDHVDVYTNLVPNKPHEIRVHNREKYFRVRLTNDDAIDQTFLRLSTKFINQVPNDQYQIDTNLNANHNVWDNYAITSNDKWSRSFDVRTKTIGALFGECNSNSTTISVEVSADDITFYSTTISIQPSASYDNYYNYPVNHYPFYVEFSIPARYYRFHCSQNCNISATFSTK